MKEVYVIKATTLSPSQTSVFRTGSCRRDGRAGPMERPGRALDNLSIPTLSVARRVGSFHVADAERV